MGHSQLPYCKRGLPVRVASPGNTPRLLVVTKLLELELQTTSLFGHETWRDGLLSIPVRFPGSRFDRAVRAREQLLTQFDQLIDQRQQNPTSKQDVLSILLAAKDEEGNALSRVDIKDNVLGMLVAGHETLTSALTSLCQLLAQHPEVLEAVRAEQLRLGNPTTLTQEALRQMTYLEQVLKEVLRLIPPVVRSGSRKVLESSEFGRIYNSAGLGCVLSNS